MGEERVVIVTGASSGIGRATARLAARKGLRVVLAARRADRLEKLAGEITSAGGVAHVVPADVALLDDQRRLVAATLQAFGRLDVLVNNAGLPLPAPFATESPEELQRQWNVNVTALATLTRLALPALQAQHGTVINIGSMISHFAVPGWGNYSPTKIAVAGLTDALRRELGPLGVHVCLVQPGPIATEFYERSGGSEHRAPPFSLPAAECARDIVRLFDHPRRRVVVPGWLGPILSVAGGVMRLAPGPADALIGWRARRQRGASPPTG